MHAIANRGFNLLAAALLGLGGLEFGSVLLLERDLTDKIDDGGFLLIGLIAIGWYLWSGDRFKRSSLPLVLAFLAVVVQIVGLLLERDDPAAFGDNIGGMLFFLPVLVLLAAQYQRTGTYLRLSDDSAWGEGDRASG